MHVSLFNYVIAPYEIGLSPARIAATLDPAVQQQLDKLSEIINACVAAFLHINGAEGPPHIVRGCPPKLVRRCVGAPQVAGSGVAGNATTIRLSKLIRQLTYIERALESEATNSLRDASEVGNKIKKSLLAYTSVEHQQRPTVGALADIKFYVWQKLTDNARDLFDTRNT